ncbi:MAG: response regulator [Methanolinea sp.]
MARILVIDDSQFQRKILTSILEKKGHEVHTAVDGREGYEKVRRERPDLVICDLLMPGIDGYSFLKDMQNEGFQIPVLVLTSDIQETTRKICLDLGACDVIHKPAKEENLLPAVERALSHRDRA